MGCSPLKTEQGVKRAEACNGAIVADELGSLREPFQPPEGRAIGILFPFHKSHDKALAEMFLGLSKIPAEILSIG